MFSRIEVSLKPEFIDPVSTPLLRRMEMTDPHLRKRVRWARCVDVFWLEVPLSREELIFCATEVLWDPVLHWLFTGNLIPSAGGGRGTVEDLLETAPNRPGNFFAIEKRFRIGVTDHPAATLQEALSTVLKRPLEGARIASGQMLLLEGPGLTEEQLARIAREYFSNELLESWTLLSEREISHSERFHPERVKREMPKAPLQRVPPPTERLPLQSLSSGEISTYSRRKGFHLSEIDLQSVREHFAAQDRSEVTDVELEIFSRVWGDRQPERWIRSPFEYRETGASDSGAARIPAKIPHLLNETVRETVKDTPRSWVISAFEDAPSLLAYDEEDAISVESEIESVAVASDAQYGTMMGVAEAALRSATAGMGAKPFAMTNVIFAPDLYSFQKLSSDALHPRRVLDGVKQGISAAGSQLGIPTVNGALYLDSKEGAIPIVHVSSFSLLPKVSAGRAIESREVSEGDGIYILGNRVGKDGLLGSPPVQIVDTVIQKKLMSFLIESREQGLTRAAFEVGTGGLAHAMVEISSAFGGAEIRLESLPSKQSGLRALDLIGSETLERMLLILPQESRVAFEELCHRRDLEFARIGEVRMNGRLLVKDGDEVVADLDSKFLREGAKRTSSPALWEGPSPVKTREYGDFAKEGVETLLRLLSHPNVASREWLVRQIDHEVQGTSAVKPLHTVYYSADLSQSGPNDSGVLKLKPQQSTGLIVSTGLQPRIADVDPHLMGQLTVDEAIRNALASGADYGKEESLFALTYQLSWPESEMQDPKLAGAIVRACYGAKEAANALQTPFVSGVERGITGTHSRFHLVVHSLSKMAKIGGARSVDFKTPGDAIYLLGPAQMGIRGSLLAELIGVPDDASTPEPNWDSARRLYAWLGGSIGKEQKKLRSLHDLSDGGLLVALAEALVARGLGAQIQFPEGLSKTMEWEFLLGEGFHGMLVSLAELDVPLVEAELTQNEIPFVKLGAVTGAGVLQVKRGENPILAIETKVLRQAWKKEGYWE